MAIKGFVWMTWGESCADKSHDTQLLDYRATPGYKIYIEIWTRYFAKENFWRSRGWRVLQLTWHQGNETQDYGDDRD